MAVWPFFFGGRCKPSQPIKCDKKLDCLIEREILYQRRRRRRGGCYAKLLKLKANHKRWQILVFSNPIGLSILLDKPSTRCTAAYIYDNTKTYEIYRGGDFGFECCVKKERDSGLCCETRSDVPHFDFRGMHFSAAAEREASGIRSGWLPYTRDVLTASPRRTGNCSDALTIPFHFACAGPQRRSRRSQELVNTRLKIPVGGPPPTPPSIDLINVSSPLCDISYYVDNFL